MSVPMTASTALNVQSRETRSAATPPSRYLCFGEFQLDTQRELLFKDGTKVRLPGKVFQTLLALLEKPGEVVTREALRERLWPEGTFVNYDANVNTTVNKLRLVLGDSPDQPAYIETIPRLGYCFVGGVEGNSELPKPAANGAARSVAAKAEAVLPLRIEAGTPASRDGVTAEPATAKAPTTSRASFWPNARNTGWAAVVLLCGVLIGIGIVLLAHRA